MNREELISQMAHDAKTTKSVAKASLDSFLSSVSKALKKGGRVSLVGFGAFSTSKRNARTGRNPKTGASIEIKAKRVARFKPGKELATQVNNVK
jgi:DNA-binding protein HU-beta